MKKMIFFALAMFGSTAFAGSDCNLKISSPTHENLIKAIVEEKGFHVVSDESASFVLKVKIFKRGVRAGLSRCGIVHASLIGNDDQKVLYSDQTGHCGILVLNLWKHKMRKVLDNLPECTL